MDDSATQSRSGGEGGMTLQRLPSPLTRDGLLEQTRSCCKRI